MYQKLLIVCASFHWQPCIMCHQIWTNIEVIEIRIIPSARLLLAYFCNVCKICNAFLLQFHCKSMHINLDARFMLEFEKKKIVKIREKCAFEKWILDRKCTDCFQVFAALCGCVNRLSLFAFLLTSHSCPESCVCLQSNCLIKCLFDVACQSRTLQKWNR